ncbi:MAG TPA: hypothetical protein PK011_12215, partial [Marinagarivorans sp.]|nr:hypothetical protein [Marinagarivorans sp.]
ALEATDYNARRNAVRDALVGYSLVAASNSQPPGSLPCPAQNRAGQPAVNGATGACLQLQGLVPYRALGLSEPLDATGTPLWYAPAAALTGNTNPPLSLRNSSTLSSLTLKLNAANRVQAVAFVLLAANAPLAGQQPVSAPLAAASQFLEGANGVNNATAYDDLRDADHNDQVLGMPLGQFWSSVEQRVLTEVQQTLQLYRLRCGAYPWAAPWGVAGYNSQANLASGALPVGTAVPVNWAASCGANQAPALAPWLRNHWGGLLHYALCDQPAGNPPSASCLQLTTAAGTAQAKAVVVAPGTLLNQQNRSLTALNHFFEQANADANPRSFTQLPPGQHTQGFNDVVFIVE